MALVEVEVDGYEINMILDALDYWQAIGCPTANPMLVSDPPALKQIEDLKQRLWYADEVIIRLQRGQSDDISADGAQ